MRANGELLQRSPILCKRQMIERVPDVTLNPGDDIISDVYTCHLLDETDSAAPYSIAIRIYNVIITSREDVLVRLGDGRVISDVTLNNDQQGQILTFDTSISRKETFTALLKPKIELWEVGTSVIEVTSSLDKRVKLRVPRNVFIKRSSSLALEILEMPEEADIIEGQIIAATPVYKLSADDTAIASLQIEVRLST
ncbi:uncharacterized protein LOC127882448 [Dreissena polymorpha]|uniref:uncharacterized protein LOC127882448 n=1 Tax=Dreissena polymorpha TaxID=45954 RepID=UPI0022656031|nr:uncharacterized protein LOC127882448 [Dreissena polymorpha]